MSIQFGKCNFDGQPVDPRDLDEVRPMLAPYGPDGEGSLAKDNYAILYRCFHTTQESRREQQPHVSKFCLVVTWDGRLDNRNDLIERLAGELSPDSTDSEIVVAGFERWGTSLFRELIGEWALSVWNPKDESLILAREFAGIRPLYYLFEKEHVRWCIILDPLVLFARHSFSLEEEYIAGWLSSFPATHLTPYVGIRAVPPSSFVRITRAAEKVTKYWDFNPAKKIRYRTDGEYEEHFRTVFAQSVRRRLRSDSPVLAELSGGMDSSSIVCIADEICRHNPSVSHLIDTVSYYDDSEPNCNDRTYFEIVEKKRGRTGGHFRLTSEGSVFCHHDDDESFRPLPPLTNRSGGSAEYTALVNSHGSRALLSGFGGDEVTGGVPTPVPELADLLARVRLGGLAHQLELWAIQERRPWIHLLLEALREFLPETLVRVAELSKPVPWLNNSLAQNHRSVLTPDCGRIHIFGALPSFQIQLKVLNVLRRQLGCSGLEPLPLQETRYPYLDRDLLEFLFAIPRQQLVRPGQRRSLMRRALVGVVPEEILNRRRKAFVLRGPMSHIANHWSDVLEFSHHMRIAALGIVDDEAFLNALQRVRLGQPVAIVSLVRTFIVERWLRNVNVRKHLNLDDRGEARSFPTPIHVDA